MKVSKNFSREEFSCKCGCGFDAVDVELLNTLQQVRDYFGEAVTITSANRCKVHNAKVSGARQSKHVKGIAADIKVDTVIPRLVYNYLDNEFPDTYGLGLYERGTSGWVHIDVRNYRARWVG
jgi:uncharacterized protein YcbK (DUF882 family)